MKLIFVYNADSGLFNTVSDIAHKVLSPKTYSCNLCALTHGHFKIRQEWVDFLEQLDIELEFLHRDEFLTRHKIPDAEFPAIFLQENDELSLWLNQSELNQITTLDDLKQVISERLQQTP